MSLWKRMLIFLARIVLSACCKATLASAATPTGAAAPIQINDAIVCGFVFPLLG
jgi:hypothetical protein